MAGGHGTGAVPESSHLFHAQQVGESTLIPRDTAPNASQTAPLTGEPAFKRCACGGILVQTTTECVKEKSPRPNPEALQDSGRREEDAPETCGETKL